MVDSALRDAAGGIAPVQLLSQAALSCARSGTPARALRGGLWQAQAGQCLCTAMAVMCAC